MKDVSFEVQRGEVLGIIGRNGAGKSTLLKILSRITEPTSGRAILRGRVASLLEVGTGFHPELTGRENIYLNGAILGMRKAEIARKFDEIVAFAEVERFIDTPVKRYSSGMYVRLAFAVAAHLEPEILLVDEVLAVGDASFQKKCLGKMGDIAKHGRTVLFVSHNMFAVQNLCNSAILLSSGRIENGGRVNEVVESYLGSRKEGIGEVRWDMPEKAPGDDRVRLKAVRVVSEDKITGRVDITKDFWVEIDYWNLQDNANRLVSMHLHNSLNIWVISTCNIPSFSAQKDPWAIRSYPRGLFRTSCRIPGCLLNDGMYSISVFLTSSNTRDVMVEEREVLGFYIQDTGYMREDYSGAWPTIIRPRLDWQTERLDSSGKDDAQNSHGSERAPGQ